jgi:quercetin dioxygenase-like cupin family protein
VRASARRSRNEIYGRCNRGSVRLDVGRADYLAALFRFIHDELAEVGARQC